jgi:hypothetical protein
MILTPNPIDIFQEPCTIQKMAFVQTAIWEVSDQRRARSSAEQPIGHLLDGLLGRLLANGRDFYASRALSAILAALIQILLMWLFLLSQVRATSVPSGQGVGARGITMLDLSTPIDATPAGASAPQQPAAATTPQPPITAPQSLVDASTSPIARPEWSVSKIIVARPSPAPVTRSAPAPALASAANGASSGTGSTGAQSGSGAGGGSGYDPNAGAAPLRRDDPSGGAYAQAPTPPPSIATRIMGFLGLATPAPPPAAFDLDEAALATARADAAGRLKGARGSVVFAVRISPTGMVLDAVIKRTSLSRPAAMAVRAAILGRRLFLPRGPVGDGGTVELPPIAIG